MKKNKNKKLLQKMQEEYLEKALDKSIDEDKRKDAFNKAMEVTDKVNDTKKNWIKVLEITVPVGITILNIASRSKLASKCFAFDKSDDIITSTVGKSFFPSLFRKD